MELKTVLKEVVVAQVETGLTVTVRQEEAVFEKDIQIGSNGESNMSFELSGEQSQQVAGMLQAQALWPERAVLVACNVFPALDGSVSVSVAFRVPLMEDGKFFGYTPTVRGVVDLDKKKIKAVTALIESFGVSLN